MKKNILYTILILFLNWHSYATAYSGVDGWSFNHTNPSEWELVSGQGTLSIDGQRLSAFVVANSSAEWVLTSEPIWVYRFSQLQLRYRAWGIKNGDFPLIRLRPGSTGPVTPGASNMENPFARAGEAFFTPPVKALNDGTIHSVTQTIYPPIQTEQIDQIVLTIHSGNQPAVLELFDLSFHDPDSETRTVLTCDRLKQASSSVFNSNVQTIPLTGQLEPLERYSRQTELTVGIVVCDEIPFELNSEPMIKSTSLIERDSIEVAIDQTCHEIFLLLGMELVGTDNAFQFVQRTEIKQPERLVVTKHYADGTRDRSFPYSVHRSSYSVEASTLGCYLVPADKRKKLERITIEEWMSYGRLFLTGLTVNGGNENLVALPENQKPLSLPKPHMNQQTASPNLTVKDNQSFVLENDYYRLVLNGEDGLNIQSLFHKTGYHDLLTQPTPLFSFLSGRMQITSEQFSIENYHLNQNGLTLVLQSMEPTLPLQFNINLKADAGTELLMQASVRNQGYTPQSLRLLFPDMRDIRLSEDIQNDYYFFPLRRVAHGNQPVRLMGVHSGEFPLQFFDLYSESGHFGLALHTRDTDLVLKRFRFEKRTQGSRMGVEFGFHLPIQIEAQSFHAFPPVMLDFHPGDWHVPFDNYRQWSRQWYTTNKASRRILKDVFICRRDYPIGGTGYLFDLTRDSYTFDRLIHESETSLGGIDMIDISGWAYSEKYGRVGNYTRYELGGENDLRHSISTCPVPVGLYLEGYLIDPRSKVGHEKASEWQIITKDGEPKTWSGNDEMFMDSYAAGWRDYLGTTLKSVAQDTNADALYVDQYGFGDSSKACFSTHHEHAVGAHPLIGEHGMLKHLRNELDKLDQPVAIYTEQVPNDISSQYTDAAFSYAMAGDVDYPSPVKLNLFRYAFPDFKVIELFHPGIDPKGISAEDAKLCFFHGEAMWLKGRAKSWYSKEFRAFTKEAYEVVHNHHDTFTSGKVEPLLPTLQRGVYANRFSSDHKMVITLYNSNLHTVRGDLMIIKKGDFGMETLLGLDNASYPARQDNVVIKGVLDPHSVGAIVIVSDEES